MPIFFIEGRPERFAPTVSKLDPSRKHSFEVELKDSGLVIPVRAANIDVQSDCEEGLYGSYEVRVLAGEHGHRDVMLTRAERDTHTKMMTCCSRATSQRLVLELCTQAGRPATVNRPGREDRLRARLDRLLQCRIGRRRSANQMLERT